MTAPRPPLAVGAARTRSASREDSCNRACHALLATAQPTPRRGRRAGGVSVPKLKRIKRPTNNRMSKGRRLSYEVQPKLVNFMFPEIPVRAWVCACARLPACVHVRNRLACMRMCLSVCLCASCMS